jgi:hypothetical protein
MTSYETQDGNVWLAQSGKVLVCRSSKSHFQSGCSIACIFNLQGIFSHMVNLPCTIFPSEIAGEYLSITCEKNVDFLQGQRYM